MDIHEILTFLRESKDIPQKVVASEIGVSKSSISEYETGDTVPSPKVLIALADYYNVNLDYIFGRTEVKSSISKIEELLKTSKDKLSIDLLISLSAEDREVIRTIAVALSKSKKYEALLQNSNKKAK